MTREELTNKFLESDSKNYVLQLPTGFGKTKLALQKVEQWYNKDYKILIAVPYKTIMTAWKGEISKWGYDRFIPNITFTTYISLPKYCNPNTTWDIVIADEVHHLSERCRIAMQYLKTNHFIGMSGTLKRDMVYYLSSRFHTELLKVTMKDAIENSVLPDPKVILLQLNLDNKNVNQIIEKNIKKSTNLNNIVTISYAEKWKYRSYKGPLRILCTQQQYYNDLTGLIEWYKQKSMGNAVMKNMWLHKAGERLKWLAKQKEEITKNILKELKNRRVLTFCQSIEQSETLGCPCVNSKIGLQNLHRFNEKKIKHIAAIAMLDEGCNLTDCQIGLFQMINSSQRVVNQRVGRELRHKNPVLIFPYFVNTREAEIVEDIMKDYNPELIVNLQIDNIKDIKHYL